MSVPQKSIGHLFGARGENLKLLQEFTNCTMKVNHRNDVAGHAQTWRLLKIVGRSPSREQRDAEVARCTRTVQILCGDQEVEIGQAIGMMLAEQEAQEEQRKLAEQAEEASKEKAKELEVVSYVAAKCGDKFNRDNIREALAEENWDSDLAMDRLFGEYQQADRNDTVKSSSINVQRLLEASRAANATRKAKVVESSDLPYHSPHENKESNEQEPSKHVLSIRNAVAQALAKGEALQQKKQQAKMSKFVVAGSRQRTM
jgi:hypothetical protein